MSRTSYNTVWFKFRSFIWSIKRHRVKISNMELGKQKELIVTLNIYIINTSIPLFLMKFRKYFIASNIKSFFTAKIIKLY